jgi:hypothetical protein
VRNTKCFINGRCSIRIRAPLSDHRIFGVEVCDEHGRTKDRDHKIKGIPDWHKFAMIRRRGVFEFGNIRELQNVIERSVILCSSEVFAVDESWLSKGSSGLASRVQTPAPLKSAAEPRSERQIIEVALAESRGRVSGPSGAAARLGIPPSTLDHRI